VERVVIGMDPHNRSATIEVVDEREAVLQAGVDPSNRWALCFRPICFC
jgi:hypothetical protein